MNEQAPKNKWYYDIWFVILILFVFGPFGFPLLWKSQKFNRTVKWILSILVLLITVVAIWGSVEMIKWAWKQIQELQASLS